MGAPLPGHGVLRGRKYERVECSQNQTGTGQREGRDEGGGGNKVCVCLLERTWGREDKISFVRHEGGLCAGYKYTGGWGGMGWDGRHFSHSKVWGAGRGRPGIVWPL